MARPRTRLAPRVLAWLAMMSVAALAAGCAVPRSPAAMAPTGQDSFATYASETRAWIAQRRDFQTDSVADELAWNAPREWRPAAPATRGMLLVHGLGDSPWSFADIGAALAAQGFLVRTVLLPGHGTRPADLVGVDLDDWRRVLREQAAILARDVPQVFLGGFSTGANLALEYALEHDSVQGLLLFSPALKSGVPGDWLLPWVARVTPWLRAPAPGTAQQSALRYLNVPTHAFAQYYRSSVAVRHKIARTQFDKPAVLVLAEHDSVVDVEHAMQTFAARFTHPGSRLIYYGALAPQATPERVLVRTDRLAAQRISQFSHMGVLFAPDNPLYGVQGTQRICWNGQGHIERARCLAGDPVWYSEWGYRESDKVHARLTYNPWFDWQSGVIAGVMGGVD